MVHDFVYLIFFGCYLIAVHWTYKWTGWDTAFLIITACFCCGNLRQTFAKFSNTPSDLIRPMRYGFWNKLGSVAWGSILLGNLMRLIVSSNTPDNVFIPVIKKTADDLGMHTEYKFKLDQLSELDKLYVLTNNSNS